MLLLIRTSWVKSWKTTDTNTLSAGRWPQQVARCPQLCGFVVPPPLWGKRAESGALAPWVPAEHHPLPPFLEPYTPGKEEEQVSLILPIAALITYDCPHNVAVSLHNCHLFPPQPPSSPKVLTIWKSLMFLSDASWFYHNLAPRAFKRKKMSWCDGWVMLRGNEQFIPSTRSSNITLHLRRPCVFWEFCFMKGEMKSLCFLTPLISLTKQSSIS